METFSALLAIVRGIHRSPVNSPYKGQRRGALMFSLRPNGWVNHGEAGALRRHPAHYDVMLMKYPYCATEQQYDVSRTQINLIIILDVTIYLGHY